LSRNKILVLKAQRFLCMCEHPKAADEIARGAEHGKGSRMALTPGVRIGAVDQPVAVAERCASLASRTPAQLNLSF
jgi:hypothetical protein